VLPVAVIVIGVLVLVRGLTVRDQGGGPAWGEAADEGGAPVPSSGPDGEPPAEAVTATPAEEPRAEG
jgi:hypothetical protein